MLEGMSASFDCGATFPHTNTHCRQALPDRVAVSGRQTSVSDILHCRMTVSAFIGTFLQVQGLRAELQFVDSEMCASEETRKTGQG